MDLVCILMTVILDRAQQTFVSEFLARPVPAFHDAVRVQDEHIPWLQGNVLLDEMRKRLLLKTIEAQDPLPPRIRPY